ncbi:hypothetical protein DFQ28_007899 [Apophysomyces sp. BC1034]|nr:hypothetical protein DFQ28_007899 [Apophysomyces sp. BC1034]
MADRHQCEFVDDASHATYHSVLDKWLERLDLHDSKEPSAYAETLVGYSSTPLTSPTLRTCQSSESLESGCSSEQATLSSSAGSALAADLGKTRLLKSNNLSNNGNMMPPQSLRRAINTATDKKTLSRSLPLSITTSLSSHRLDSDRDRTSHPSILNRSSIISDHDMDHFAYEVFAFEDETTPASPLQLTEQLPPCMPPPTSPLPPLPGLLQRIGQNGSISSNRRQ